MDWIKVREETVDVVKKYRYVILVVAVGLVLMALPERQETQKAPEITEATDAEPDLAAQLGQILSAIDGAGKVQVMLTEAKGSETLYQSDTDADSGENSTSQRQDTVIVSDSSRQEQGLVRQINPPVYQGAIVICQGADKAAVRLAIVEAVSCVTGLGSDRISVLKMK